jgi:hypothetical protein
MTTVSSSLAGVFNSGLAALKEALSRVGGASSGERARISGHALRVAVRAFRACLGNLPDNLRRVLELTTGIDVPKPLGPAAVAESLRVSTRELPELERLGLRRLLTAARAHACAADTHARTGLVSFSTLGTFASEEGGPSGGVAAAVDVTSPTALPGAVQSAKRSSGANPSVGISVPVAAGGALLLIILGLAGVLAVGLLSAGIAPWELHPEKRTRWIHRHPWNWHW